MRRGEEMRAKERETREQTTVRSIAPVALISPITVLADRDNEFTVCRSLRSRALRLRRVTVLGNPWLLDSLASASASSRQLLARIQDEAGGSGVAGEGRGNT